MNPDLISKLTQWRHQLHMNPELSTKEYETAEFIVVKLFELGVSRIERIGDTGVVGTILREGSESSVALRADTDALPIDEQSIFSHKSRRPGVMHACGHDGHVVMLLGAAALLLKCPNWTGTVHLIFQPAEEGFGGAKTLVNHGLFKKFAINRIFGLHNWPGLDVGAVGIHRGAVMAASSALDITIAGKSGHAAMPHMTSDPNLVVSYLVGALQSIVSRNVDPLESAVVSVCIVQSGTTRNQIPTSATLAGTVRTLSREVLSLVEKRIRLMAKGFSVAFDVEIDLDFRPGTEVINSLLEAEIASKAADQMGLTVRHDLAPSMAAEDFGEYLRHVPGAYSWIGSGPTKNGHVLHNASYDFNDQIIPIGAQWMANVAMASLKQ
ncbi:amidohydrolase [Bradyrhizobium sp. sGM-13]|uniref:amidohydrolase n=1 Tax=Bradyrhizobium sp. sGM-13 TaxID=2831781 RepID=UPI001BCA9C4B|nr:amidohydrolase [Bradyrhizobium sp. sGM-13]